MPFSKAVNRRKRDRAFVETDLSIGAEFNKSVPIEIKMGGDEWAGIVFRRREQANFLQALQVFFLDAPRQIPTQGFDQFFASFSSDCLPWRATTLPA